MEIVLSILLKMKMKTHWWSTRTLIYLKVLYYMYIENIKKFNHFNAFSCVSPNFYFIILMAKPTKSINPKS